MNGKSYLLAALSLCGLGTLTGCDPGLMYPTTTYVTKMGENMGKAIEAHDDNMTEQHKIQTPEVAAELDAQRELFTQRMAELDKQLAEARAEQDRMWQMILKNGGDIVKGALQIAGVPSVVTDMLMPKIDAAKDEADVAMNKAMLVGAKADTVASAVSDAMEELDEIQQALARLSDETRDKFASVTQDTMDRLSALRTDDAEFRRVLQQDLQLTAAEMEGLKGMSTEQILALLAAAGGAAGIGVAGGRGGKSRAQPEIEKLKESVAGITAAIERMKPPVT